MITGLPLPDLLPGSYSCCLGSPPKPPPCTQLLDSDSAAGEPKWLPLSKLLLAEIPCACNSVWAQSICASPRSAWSSQLPFHPRGSILSSGYISILYPQAIVPFSCVGPGPRTGHSPGPLYTEGWCVRQLDWFWCHSWVEDAAKQLEGPGQHSPYNKEVFSPRRQQC